MLGVTIDQSMIKEWLFLNREIAVYVPANDNLVFNVYNIIIICAVILYHMITRRPHVLKSVYISNV